MLLRTIKIFIASSEELKADREEFRTFISVENDRLKEQGIYLEIVQWEYFLSAISDTSLQSEYNKAIRECDIVLCLFFTKVGKYTAEEFNTAYQIFKATGKPKILTYFKEAPVNAIPITDDDLTLDSFKEKLKELGHFHSVYTNTDNLKYQFRIQLDKFLGAEKKDVSNDLLTRRLMEAVQVYTPRAKKFLENVTRMASDWERQTRFSDSAKEILAFSYVGVLGIQLRKLMAIGKEERSDNKFKKYLEVCQLTCKRSLQLLCFTLISKLWDFKKGQDHTLLPSQQAILQNFFDSEFESDINGFVRLLTTLMDAFGENKLSFPISELDGFGIHLQQGSDFLVACSEISTINELLDKASYTVHHCCEAERHLATILEVLNFLVNYKMVSIKSIGYFETRNTKPYYLYTYTALGIDARLNINQERINYAEAPINTDAVLLYKGNYQQNVNLFPFVIDVNALTFEGGAKICFYACHDSMDNSLVYHFLEDNSKVNVADSGTLNQRTDINELWMDPEKRKDMRFDTVFKLFQEARKTVTGIEVVEEDDFQNPF